MSYGRQEEIFHKTNNMPEKYHLLLSTTYSLNTSNTKKLHVGLQLTGEGTFKPVVRLTGNYSEGIDFDTDAWVQFQKNMELMSVYLNGSSKTKINSVSWANVFVSFTTAYGARAILVAPKENENTQAESEISAREGQPSAKKRKTYPIAVVMLKATFQGMYIFCAYFE